MPLILIYLGLFGALCFSPVQAQGLSFEPETRPWAALKAQAQSEQKLLFVNLSASWCVTCRRMAQQVYPLDSVGQFFRQYFIALELDGEKDSLAKVWVKELELRGYPAFIFLNASGEVLHYGQGYRNPAELLALAREALSPKTQILSLQKRHQGGEREPDFLQAYAYALHRNRQPQSEAVLADYLQTQKHWLAPRNQRIILDLAQDPDTEAFQFLVKHQKGFGQTLGETEVQAKLQAAAMGELGILLYQKGEDFDLSQDIYPVMERFFPKDLAQRKTQYLQLGFYANEGEWEAFFPSASSYERYYLWFKRRLGDDEARAREYLELAAMVSNNSTERKHLKWASKRARRSVLLNPSYRNCHALAAYHYQLGNIRLAKKYLRKAMKRRKRLSKADVAFLAELEQLRQELRRK